MGIKGNSPYRRKKAVTRKEKRPYIARWPEMLDELVERFPRFREELERVDPKHPLLAFLPRSVDRMTSAQEVVFFNRFYPNGTEVSWRNIPIGEAKVVCLMEVEEEILSALKPFEAAGE